MAKVKRAPERTKGYKYDAFPFLLGPSAPSESLTSTFAHFENFLPPTLLPFERSGETSELIHTRSKGTTHFSKVFLKWYI